MSKNTSIILLWAVSLIISLSIGYIVGSSTKSKGTDVLSANTTPTPMLLLTPTPQVVASGTPTVANSPTPTVAPTPDTRSCTKTGYAQNWEYLTSYVVKQGDSLETIAKEQLHDETRVNEILKINGVGLVVGETIYLPPSNISKSSGNLKQVYGKLLSQDKTSWHVGFSNDPKGQGILIPSFWFEKLPNKDSFKIGDCIKVFFDDGYTVYSVGLQ